MARTSRAPRVDWTATPQGRAKYASAHAYAQELANRDGFDRGLERNDTFHTFSVFMLPKRENRSGHETRCEVVSCEDIARTQPGRGVA